MALEKIIERADYMSITGAQVVSAIQTYVKLNILGQGTEPAQLTKPKELFERVSKDEREAFVRDGALPDWFSGAKGATPSHGQGGEKGSQITETKGLQ